MRVRFLKSIAACDFDYQVGQVADLDESTARAWCESGVAEPADAPEAAITAGAPENAMRPKARRR